ncbi:hypothetical protein BC826DRAFT_1013187 [Russula brevipes]|nr:hypothetical protein BC826DRAFT_1013187 [Russula brevipes]
MGSQTAETKPPQETLSPYFDTSAAAVRQTFARYAPQSTHKMHVPSYPKIQLAASLERTYILPIFDLFRALFLAYPIPFVFTLIFVTFSFFPVLAFIIASMATLSAALTFALCLAFVFSTGVSLLLGSVLLATLGFALVLSGFLTAFAVAAYLLGRLAFDLYRFGRSGFRIWSQEVAHIFFPFVTHLVADEDQYTSEDSGILDGRATKNGRVTETEHLLPEASDSDLKHVG